ncbi:Hypp3329 [Branchiostoma lanceolatum]|uniref:Hypp3329 protein n=1 Tax=Branchiostoma lanceolatum TaxID=7740 RepID=A0A8J9ZZ76_BRALA|nr:Hypp3329 [Branchiostoma lanceolatum]
MAWQHTYVPLQLEEVEVCSTGPELEECDGEPPDDVEVITGGVVLPAATDLSNDGINVNKGGRPKKRKPVVKFEVGNQVRRMSTEHIEDGNDSDEDHSFTKYQRVDSDICSLARRPSLDDTPGSLRPKKRPPTLLESLASASASRPASVTEARIFHVPFMLELMAEFYALHRVRSPKCMTPDMTMPLSLEKKWGFGYWEALGCRTCGVTTPRRKVYQEAERIPGHKRGPKPGRMNVQVALGLTKVPVGHSGLNTLFCSVELAGPAKSSLHSLATGLSGPVVALAQQALADNRGRLRQVMQLRGNLVEDGKPLAIAAAADGCYNNPCYKGFHQKSTQAALPVREQETSENMLIGFGFANKFGKVGEASTYPKSEPIGNAEEWLAGKVTQEMYQCKESPLLLKALVTDGSGQIYRGAQSATQNLQPDFNIEQQDCTVHASRRQRSSVFRTNLSSQLVSGKVGFSGKVTQDTTKAFCTVLSKAIGSRCSGELKRARGHHPTDDSKYLKSVSDAKNNILDCFSGNHTKCSALSFVCPCDPVASDHVPSYLPRKKYLLLTEEDRMELNEVLDFTMSEASAMKQRYLRSTNSVEAMHRCMHRSLPKSLNFTALAEMRAYSAVHSKAVGGMGESLARLGQQFGVAPQPGGEAARRLLQLDRQADADRRRQQSDGHRISRKRASVKTVSKRVKKLMSDSSPPAHLPHEHAYLRSEDD